MNGGDELVYMASADWMRRNLDKRVELMFPVTQPDHKATIIHAPRAMFRDNVKARCLREDGAYERKHAAPGEPPFRVQTYLQDTAHRAVALARDRAGITLRPERAQDGDGARRRSSINQSTV